jgi:cell wall-associated NlpC family hydrolase
MTIEQLRQAVVLEALSWEGTPFHVASSAKGPGGGVDCAGLVMATFSVLGMVVPEPLPYVDPQYASHNRRSLILAWLNGHPDLCRDVSAEVTLEEFGQKGIQSGDVVCYRYGLCVHHCGIAISKVYTVQAVYPHGVTRFDMTGPLFRKQYQATFRALPLCL